MKQEDIMPKAFIMIDVEPGSEKKVQEKLKTEVQGIQFVYQITGEHDMIAFLDVEPYDNFAYCISVVRGVEGVKDTNTELVIG